MNKSESDWGDGKSTTDYAPSTKSGFKFTPKKVIGITVAIIVAGVVITSGISSLAGQASPAKDGASDGSISEPIIVNPGSSSTPMQTPTETPTIVPTAVPSSQDPAPVEDLAITPALTVSLTDAINQFGAAYSNTIIGKPAWLAAIQPLVGTYQYSVFRDVDITYIPKAAYEGFNPGYSDSTVGNATLKYAGNKTVYIQMSNDGEGHWTVVQVAI